MVRTQAIYDLKGIADDVRRRIIEWQRKRVLAGETNIAELKEFTDYKVIVKLDHSDLPSVSIHCELCEKPYKLMPKTAQQPAAVMLSNWTGHIKGSIEKVKKDENGVVVKPKAKQHNLLMILVNALLKMMILCRSLQLI